MGALARCNVRRYFSTTYATRYVSTAEPSTSPESQDKEQTNKPKPSMLAYSRYSAMAGATHMVAVVFFHSSDIMPSAMPEKQRHRSHRRIHRFNSSLFAPLGSLMQIDNVPCPLHYSLEPEP